MKKAWEIRRDEEEWTHERAHYICVYPLPIPPTCEHGSVDPVGCAECDMNVDCPWAEGGDCKCQS